MCGGSQPAQTSDGAAGPSPGAERTLTHLGEMSVLAWADMARGVQRQTAQRARWPPGGHDPQRALGEGARLTRRDPHAEYGDRGLVLADLGLLRVVLGDLLRLDDHALVGEPPQPFREQSDLELLQADARHPPTVAGLQEEGPVTRLPDGARDEP